jgi:hypothetical protein
VVSNGQFIAYYRVSTTKQGRSGLGVEAQQAAVERYLNGGPTARKGPSPRSPPGSNESGFPAKRWRGAGGPSYPLLRLAAPASPAATVAR